MYTSPLIILALASAALALPTNNATDAFSLEKRSSRPWLGQFQSDDGVCRDPDHEERGTFRQPETRMGGSWGSGEFGISSWSAFANDDCTGAVKTKITRKGKEDGFCFTLDSLGCLQGTDVSPCWFQSVKGNA